MMGLCQLCDKHSKLIDAHLIPKCMYDFDGELPIKVISIFGGARPKRAPVGIYDANILCGGCDNRIGVWDQHACKLFSSKTRRLSIAQVADGPAIDERGVPLCYKIEDAEPELISKFVLSVIWRCHVSTREEAKMVKLGPHAESIKDIIKQDISLSSHNYRVRLQFNIDFAIAMIVGRNKLNGKTINTFHAQNFGFHLNTTNNISQDEFEPLYVQENRDVLAVSFLNKETQFGKSVISGLKHNQVIHGDPWKNMRASDG
jgi:hypothetical protein